MSRLCCVSHRLQTDLEEQADLVLAQLKVARAFQARQASASSPPAILELEFTSRHAYVVEQVVCQDCFETMP